MRVDSRTAPTASSRTSEPPRTATPSSSTFTRWSSAGWWAVRGRPEGPRLAAGGALAVTRILGRYARRVPGLRRIAFAAVALLVAVVLVVVVTVVVTVRRPLPDWSGAVEVPGLSADVEVLRDARGVPQIYADTAGDLFYAQGYVHAQDRFFEMDLRRHITAGRLSELVGENADALQADRVVRTLGWRRVAEQELPLLAPSTREYLQAYADGVNAYVRGPLARRPVRRVLGARPRRRRAGDRAVDARRLPRVAQGDGVGPAQQLRRGARPGDRLRPGRRRRAGEHALPAVPGGHPRPDPARRRPGGRLARRRAAGPGRRRGGGRDGRVRAG